jgi:hypothetical protein
LNSTRKELSGDNVDENDISHTVSSDTGTVLESMTMPTPCSIKAYLMNYFMIKTTETKSVIPADLIICLCQKYG